MRNQQKSESSVEGEEPGECFKGEGWTVLMPWMAEEHDITEWPIGSGHHLLVILMSGFNKVVGTESRLLLLTMWIAVKKVRIASENRVFIKFYSE